MKIDIARQPLVPAFVTLFALAVTAMWGGAGNGVSAGAPETMPLLGGALARFQAAYPVWARLAAGFMILFTGMCTGRIAIRYNLYGVSTCLPIPLYAVVACGIVSGGNYLTAFAASMLLALAAKNYCRSYCNGYGFDAIFRASLYLGLLPLVYAPATPLVLILPLAILLFRRTFREVVVAAAGLILPVLTASYVSWGAGDEFTAPVMTLADALVSGVPLWIFKGLPLPSLVMLCVIAALALTALLFFLSDIYAAGTKPRFILIFNTGILAMTLALLCTPSVTPEAFTLTAVPAALLFPVFFVRIDRRIALPVYLILLAASVYIATLQ
ncbi:hypothetical protein [Alistipes finegoldii]|uniref:hypothetical protein n=1 Tax=Alistipes finegoldii TaxID=214856 RepID=UPI002431CCC6|nr:hypothetical protein [Alistipes finegoldii]